MRYFRLFDDISDPDGDQYRVSTLDVVEYHSPEVGWKTGGWLGLSDLQSYVDAVGGKIVFEEEKCPVS